MKKGTRRVLFWFAVVIFGVATYVAILYAQGYTYDFTKNAFVRTGAVAITANVDAQMTINSHRAGPMALLSHRVGVSRLSPGAYAIVLTKEGYTSWSKTATVQEGLLTDFPSVLLVSLASESRPELHQDIATALSHSYMFVLPTPAPKPKKPAPTPPTQITQGDITLHGTVLYRMVDGQLTPIADHVLGFALTDNNDRVLWWTQNEIWVFWIGSTDYQPYRSAGEQLLITRFSVPIARAGWFRDRDHVVVDLGSGNYRIVETDLRGGINIISVK